MLSVLIGITLYIQEKCHYDTIQLSDSNYPLLARKTGSVSSILESILFAASETVSAGHWYFPCWIIRYN
jgi:hypothetical protein